MAKTTAELAAAKAGATGETNGMGAQEKPLRPAGVYQLKDDNGNIVDEQITKNHRLFGDGQAAAFERVGYKYLRPAEPGEVAAVEVIPPIDDLGSGASDDLKGLKARLNEQDKVIAELLAKGNAPAASEVVTKEVTTDPMGTADTKKK